MSEELNAKMKPLQGVRVLEYAIYHAGPGCGAILGDLGADVIKIESGAGDPERSWKNLNAAVNLSFPNDEGLMHHVSNRNKRGICLDVRTPKGRETLNRLIEKADVFLVNLRPSTKALLGLDYATLSKVNPRLIHANISGYGPKGPLSDLGAYDPLGQARSGMMYANGSKIPTPMHLAVLDQATAIAASHAILTALFVRERHGVGQELDVSLYGTALWLLYVNLAVNSLLGVDPGMPWERSGNSPLRNCFCCKGGDWIMGVNHPEEKYWQNFCEATNRPDLVNDPRFDTEEKRLHKCPELVGIFDEVFRNKTREEWIEILQVHGLLFTEVYHIHEVLQDVQAVVNGYVVDFDSPRTGKIKIPGYPVRFSRCEAGTRSAGPALGEHTEEVLRELGYSEEEIEAGKKEGVYA